MALYAAAQRMSQTNAVVCNSALGSLMMAGSPQVWPSSMMMLSSMMASTQDLDTWATLGCFDVPSCVDCTGVDCTGVGGGGTTLQHEKNKKQICQPFAT